MAARQSTGFPLSGVQKKAPPNVELMPPSKFETSNVSDPWKELAVATNEIMYLRQQVDSQKHQQISCPGSGDGGELLQRAPVELYQKRSLEKLSHLEDQLAHKEAEHHRQIVKLEAQVHALQQEKSKKVLELEQQHKLEQQLLTSEMSRVNGALQDKSEQLKQLQQQHDSFVQQAQSTNSESTAALEQYKSQLAQFKKYISESEEVANSTYVWQKHTEQLKQQLKDVETEKQNLESGVHLLNIRLKSQMDIQHLQEQQLCQGPDKKKQSQLLQRWREKVFELLVQLESSQLTYRRDFTQWKYRYESTEDELEKEKQENEVLRHYLKDKEAQIQLHQSKVKVLESELSRAEQLAIHLDDKCKEQQATVVTLCDFANSVYEKCMGAEKPFKEVQSKLDSLNQRISFATGRVEMLQSQFLRREAIMKMEIQDRSKDQLNESGDPDNSNKHMLREVSAELERVQQERDRLAGQIKQDALTLQQRIEAAHRQVSDEIKSVKSENTGLHQQLEDKENELQALLYKLEGPEKLDAQSSRKSQVKGSTPAEQFVVSTEQQTQMQLELSQARKEHSKALVLVRQLERQLERDREKNKTELSELEFYYKQQIVQLEEHVSTLSTDRNILMTNCQQEGLVNKREAPVEGTVDAIEELKHLSEELLQDSDDMSVEEDHQQ